MVLPANHNNWHDKGSDNDKQIEHNSYLVWQKNAEEKSKGSYSRHPEKTLDTLTITLVRGVPEIFDQILDKER